MREPADTDDAPSEGGATLTFRVLYENLKSAKAGAANV
jgi:hypothetical protein